MFFLFTTIGIGIGIYLVWRQAEEALYSEYEVFDTCFLSIFSGFIFARIGYIAQHRDIFDSSLIRWAAFWVYPGFYLYAGLIGALFVLWYQAKMVKEFHGLRLLDFFVFAFWVSAIFSYFGAFLSHMEQGITSSIFFIEHPVSLYKMVGFLVVLIPYLFYRKETDKEDYFHKKEGSVGMTGFFLFGIIMFLSDFFKEREIWYGLSVDQWIDVLLSFISFIILYRLFDRNLYKDIQFIKKITVPIQKKFIQRRKKR